MRGVLLVTATIQYLCTGAIYSYDLKSICDVYCDLAVLYTEYRIIDGFYIFCINREYFLVGGVYLISF